MVKILCVEDEAEIREDIVEELGDAGFETIEAVNGLDGLEAIKGLRPDLVLCDVTMPVMNGFELMSTLRENHPEFAEMPVVFLSALADRKDVIAGRKLGADDYLTKPIDYEILIVTVESRLEQVRRMKARKQEQLVKLYNALVPPDDRQAETPVDIMTVVSVVNDEVGITETHEALEASGHVVIKLDSGRRFLDCLDKLSPDLLLISHNTNDLQAPMTVKLMKATRDVRFPVVLLLPPSMADRPGTDGRPEFDDIVQLPCSHEVLMKHIEQHSVTHAEPAADLLALA